MKLFNFSNYNDNDTTSDLGSDYSYWKYFNAILIPLMGGIPAGLLFYIVNGSNNSSILLKLVYFGLLSIVGYYAFPIFLVILWASSVADASSFNKLVFSTATFSEVYLVYILIFNVTLFLYRYFNKRLNALKLNIQSSLDIINRKQKSVIKLVDKNQSNLNCLRSMLDEHTDQH